MSPEALAAALVLAFALSVGAGTAAQDSLPAEKEPDEMPVDPQSGLVIDTGWELVRANCSGCHSTSLVTQNRMSAERWRHTIRWMQQKHNLWDLGDGEPAIIAYLQKHYGEDAVPARRQPLNQPPLEQPSRNEDSTS